MPCDAQGTDRLEKKLRKPIASCAARQIPCSRSPHDRRRHRHSVQQPQTTTPAPATWALMCVHHQAFKSRAFFCSHPPQAPHPKKIHRLPIVNSAWIWRLGIARIATLAQCAFKIFALGGVSYIRPLFNLNVFTRLNNAGCRKTFLLAFSAFFAKLLLALGVS